VKGEYLSGRVVTHGQQLLEEGSAITIPEEATTPSPARREAPAE